MIEKVNPSHPDKMADRIAGAIVDLAYKKQENPKIAVEVLIGHGYGHVDEWFPNYGCSAYKLQDGQDIVWCYTCNGLGADVGEFWMG